VSDKEIGKKRLLNDGGSFLHFKTTSGYLPESVQNSNVIYTK